MKKERKKKEGEKKKKCGGVRGGGGGGGCMAGTKRSKIVRAEEEDIFIVGNTQTEVKYTCFVGNGVTS